MVVPCAATRSPGRESSQFPPCSAARSTITEPLRMVATMPASMSRGAGRPGTRAAPITMSWRLSSEANSSDCRRR